MSHDRNIKIVVEYDGTEYHGFQLQPGKRTIQGELEQALKVIAKEQIRITGSGRTDAGVHALGQVVNFRIEGTIPTDRIAVALNSVLPADIVVREAVAAPSDFHARYWAKLRIYRYTILNDPLPSALWGRFIWHVWPRLNMTAMRRGAEYLIGVHDFTSFSAETDAASRIREVRRLSIRRRGKFVEIDIEANAFLHSMARIIVGTLVEVGHGRREPDQIKNILEGRDRRLAGMTAPPQGLALMEVVY